MTETLETTLQYFNAFNNTCKSWGDAMIEEEYVEECKPDLLSIDELIDKMNAEINNFKQEYEQINDEEFDKNYNIMLEELDKNYIMHEEDLNIINKYLEDEIKLLTIDDDSIDLTHPVVIDYRIADYICSLIWANKNKLEEKLKTLSDNKSKKLIIEDIIHTIHEWIKASDSRFETMRRVSNIFKEFDFNGVFRIDYPDEENRDHCIDMLNTYNAMKKWAIHKYSKKLKSL